MCGYYVRLLWSIHFTPATATTANPEHWYIPLQYQGIGIMQQYYYVKLFALLSHVVRGILNSKAEFEEVEFAPHYTSQHKCLELDIFFSTVSIQERHVH
ncbi:hypothetical protein F5Y12DRAFT_775526 [Xylaria sp. FL1777]|nr:hypothetical protein F5Y12DRAFT_775526 [Xylaria sp. FL1777]